MRVLIKFSNINERKEVSRQLSSKGFDVSIEHLAFGSYYVESNGTITPIRQTVIKLNEGVYIVGTGAISMFVAGREVEKNLNTPKYCCKSKKGYRTGAGFTFEDLFSRAERKKGKSVDASKGKTNEWGGPDVLVNGIAYQCKCSLNAKRIADKIQARNGYPNQLIVTNKELAKPLREELKKRERDGSMPKGVANRVIESEITYSEVRLTNRAFTKESLLFDSKTAISTGIVTAIVVFGVTLGVKYLKDKSKTRSNVMKAVKYSLIAGMAAFVLHMGWKQFQRV